MAKGNVLIVGGGPTGCAAALEIAGAGYGVTVVEAEEKLGGLASHKIFNGNVFEYGTHVFHTDSPALLQQVKKLMGDELLEIERGSKIHIKFHNRYVAYPLQGADLLANLPKRVAVSACLSFLKSVIFYEMLMPRHPRTTEEYLIQKFGKVLYEEFFRDYSRKVWGAPCSELEALFGIQRIPRSDIFSVSKKILAQLGLTKFVDSHPLSEAVIGNIFYTARGAGRMYEVIGEEVRRLGGAILLGTTLKRLVVENNRARAAVLEQDGETMEIEPDFIVSSIPLPVLAECLGKDMPDDVLQATRNLRYRSISLMGFLVARPQIRPAYFTYFPKLTFNRLSEPTNHGLKIAPEGHTLLIAETVCAYQDAAYRAEPAFAEKVIDEIVDEGLFKRSEIVETHPYAWRYAYPIYTLGFVRDLDKVNSYLAGLRNLHSTGRHGKFNYVNMHVAMRMGMDSLNELNKYAGSER